MFIIIDMLCALRHEVV